VPFDFRFDHDGDVYFCPSGKVLTNLAIDEFVGFLGFGYQLAVARLIIPWAWTARGKRR
jgi:hypothetical protein